MYIMAKLFEVLMEIHRYKNFVFNYHDQRHHSSNLSPQRKLWTVCPISELGL